MHNQRCRNISDYTLIIAGPLLRCRVQQLRSSGWEWTSTPFQPLQGFEAMPEYPEYSTGASCNKRVLQRAVRNVMHRSQMLHAWDASCPAEVPC